MLEELFWSTVQGHCFFPLLTVCFKQQQGKQGTTLEVRHPAPCPSSCGVMLPRLPWCLMGLNLKSSKHRMTRPSQAIAYPVFISPNPPSCLFSAPTELCSLIPTTEHSLSCYTLSSLLQKFISPPQSRELLPKPSGTKQNKQTKKEATH